MKKNRSKYNRSQYIDILESADMLNEIAEEIADKKGITVQEAWKEALEELKEVQKEYKELKI